MSERYLKMLDIVDGYLDLKAFGLDFELNKDGLENSVKVGMEYDLKCIKRVIEILDQEREEYLD